MDSSYMVQYQKGDVILKQGDFEKNIYRVLSGNVVFYRNYGEAEEVQIGSVRTAPEYFGEIMLLAKMPSYYTVVAQDEVSVLKVSEKDFINFLLYDASNAVYIVVTMAQNASLTDAGIDMSRLLEKVQQNVQRNTMNRALLQHLVKKYADVELQALTRVEETYDEEQRAQVIESLFLPGHKGYRSQLLPDCEQYLYEKEFICPHCGHKVIGKRINYTKLTPVFGEIGQERYDFRALYENFSAEWYEVLTCPYCCFSAFSDTFQQPIEAPRKERYGKRLAELRAALPQDFANRKDLDYVFAQHYLALICADAFHDEYLNKAQLWLNLSWLYEDMGDTVLMETAMKNAVEAYREVYSVSDLSSAQRQRIFLLIGSMQYRLGERTNARRWLLQVKMIRDGKPIYMNMADRLIQIIREEMAMEEWEQKRKME